jgi:hypothetical protein
MVPIWVLAFASTVIADATTTIPDYFQTSYGPYAGTYTLFSLLRNLSILTSLIRGIRNWTRPIPGTDKPSTVATYVRPQWAFSDRHSGPWQARWG